MPAPPFFRAYLHQQQPYQRLLLLFWYTDDTRQSVHGLNLLLDFNPPWDGSIKDLIVYPPLPEVEIQVRFIEPWHEQLVPLSEEEARKELVDAFLCHRGARVRLPQALIEQRARFLEAILALKESPGTRPFQAADFDYLCTHGTPPEEIKQAESPPPNGHDGHEPTS